MRQNRTIKILTVMYLAAALVVTGCGRAAPVKAPTKLVVKAVYSKTVPKIDGRAAEAVWRKAAETAVLLNDSSRVRIKALYTDSRVYLVLKWQDEKPDDGVKYWEFDGTRWHIDFGGDMVGLFWDISIKDFDTKGCQPLCHRFEEGEESEYHMWVKGNNLADGTPFPGWNQRADVWKWTPGVMNNLHYVDDGIFAAEKSYVLSPKSFKACWLRMFFERDGDSGTSPPWFRNENKAEELETFGGVYGEEEEGEEDSRPSLKFKDGLTIEQKPYPDRSDLEEITDYSIFKAGDKIPHFYYCDPKDPVNKALFPNGRAEGSRLDISGYATWENGEWTLEISRKLDTGYGKEDVQFKPDKSKTVYYPFSVAIFKDLKPEDFANHLKSPPVSLGFEPKP